MQAASFLTNASSGLRNPLNELAKRYDAEHERQELFSALLKLRRFVHFRDVSRKNWRNDAVDGVAKQIK